MTTQTMTTIGTVTQAVGTTLATGGLYAETVRIADASPRPLVEVTTGPDNLRELLRWAEFLSVSTVELERQKQLANFTVTGVHGGCAYTVRGQLPRTATDGFGARTRFPGMKVEYGRRAISGTHTDRGVVPVEEFREMLRLLDRA